MVRNFSGRQVVLNRIARSSRFRLVGGALLAALSLLSPGLVSAQPGPLAPPAAASSAPAAGKMQFTKQQQFRLRIDLPDADRDKLKHVQLYVGGPGGNWALKETAPPTQTHFNFKAPQDGEYWFTIVTVDKANRPTPADVTKEQPAFVVVVDTTQPDVNVSGPVAGKGQGDEVIRCSVKDANPDPAANKFEYQTADNGWRALEPVSGQPDLFRCPDRKNWSGQVRVTATDMAKNVAVRESALASPQGGGGAVEVGQHSTEKRGPELDASVPAPAASSGASAQRLVLRDKHAVLEYRVDKVGPSGVGKVEVWLTADEGKTWQYQCDDADRRSPVEFDLPKEGAYGVALVVLNGILVGDPPPAPGTAPDCWVEMDVTKPTAQLLAVRPGGGTDAWSMVISWSASDRNLGETPIDLYFSTQREGPWQSIARGVKNDGNYVWTAPKDQGHQFFVRMEVADKAGNMVRCDAPQAVVLDMSRPKPTITGLVPTNAPPRGD